jgi:hypothetical protein
MRLVRMISGRGRGQESGAIGVLEVGGDKSCRILRTAILRIDGDPGIPNA